MEEEVTVKQAKAKELIGKHITAWTATHGVYSGTLLDVICTPGKPWRGRVETEELIDAQGTDARRWYATGTVIEVGNCSIKPA